MRTAIEDDIRAVGPYVAPVKLASGGTVSPGNLREKIRRGGSDHRAAGDRCHGREAVALQN